MDVIALPDPADDHSGEAHSDQAAADQQGPTDGAKRRAKPRILSAEDCVAAMSQLSAFVMMGFLTPARANSMRAVYEAILRHHERQRASGPQQTLDQDSLLDALERHPEIANSLESILTDEQIATLLRSSTEGSRHGTS